MSLNPESGPYIGYSTTDGGLVPHRYEWVRQGAGRGISPTLTYVVGDDTYWTEIGPKGMSKRL